jgi:hypothetical protein
VIVGERCPTCGQLYVGAVSYLTPRERALVSAWWHTGSVQLAAVMVDMAEQTAKNVMRTARIRNHVNSNAELAGAHLSILYSKPELVRLHNQRMKEVA